ncbi:hypothetical protein [Flagellimonas pacifica]|nr:hypothetical protein [Allomuricauda parva]
MSLTLSTPRFFSGSGGLNLALEKLSTVLEHVIGHNPKEDVQYEDKGE